MKIHVVVQNGEFIARYELARRVRVFAAPSRTRFGKWLRPRTGGKREDSFGRSNGIIRNCVACSSRRLLRGSIGTARGIVSGFLLRAQRRRQKDAQGCCYTPITHLLLLKTF